MDIFVVSAIILSIHKHYLTDCIYLIAWNASTEEHFQLIEIQKILNTNDVMVSSIYTEIFISKYNKEFEQLYRKPLYVLSNHHTVKKIKNVEYMSKAIWLTYVTNNVTFEIFSEINIPFDCMFLIAHQCHMNHVCLREMYRVAIRLPLQEQHIGIWGKRIKYTDTNRRDMGDHVVNIASQMNSPYTLLNNNSAGNYLLSGIFGELWTALEQHLHFRSEIYQSPDRAWGVLLENGSWNGMIAMILRGEVEVAVAQFTMTSQRTEVIDFMSQLSQGRYCVFMKNPGSEPNVWKSFVAPFSGKLWLMILLSYFILALFLKYCAHFDNENTFTSIIFVVYISLLQQSESVKNRTTSYRIITLMCYVMSVTFLAAYSASLISSLAVRTIRLPFQTFEELAKDHSYQVGIRKYSPECSYFKDTNDSFLHSIYNRIVTYQKDNSLSPQEGVQSMCERKDKYVYISTDFLVEEITKGMMDCKIVLLQKACIKTSLSMVIKKNSPYRRIWTYTLNRLRVSGILQRAHRKTNTQDLHGDNWITVSVEHIIPLLSILGTGIFISAVLLLVENLYYFN